MLLQDVEPDMRVTVTTPHGTTRGTVLTTLPADANTAERVRVAYDRGGKWRDLDATTLTPLAPEQDPRDPDGPPRVWRWDMGWLFWRGGRPYLAYHLIDAWRVIEWFDDPEREGWLVAHDERTRAEAIATAVEKVDARAIMRFRKDVMPSMRGGEAPAGLTGDGWEVWRVAGSRARYEIAYDGGLKGWIELRPEGWAVVELGVDDDEYELWLGVPHSERAAMLLRSMHPFAE
ncbi:hypothetical protein ACFWZT_00750 [Streptomyces alboflavus]|uniref:hypothetical protein n=1 Tax=Streptomyces alboflavus TaxID=67267 RepID=UPI0036AFE823